MLYRIICKYEYTDEFLELTILNPLDDEKSSNSSTHRPCKHRQMFLETHVCIAGQIQRQIYQILFSLSEPARVTNVRSQSMWYVYSDPVTPTLTLVYVPHRFTSHIRDACKFRKRE